MLERNQRVRSWYERLGWEPTGERKPVYAPGGIDDVGYRRRLSAEGLVSGAEEGLEVDG